MLEPDTSSPLVKTRVHKSTMVLQACPVLQVLRVFLAAVSITKVFNKQSPHPMSTAVESQQKPRGSLVL